MNSAKEDLRSIWTKSVFIFSFPYNNRGPAVHGAAQGTDDEGRDQVGPRPQQTGRGVRILFISQLNRDSSGSRL